MNNKVLDRIHICLCPIILGGGRPSFIQENMSDLINLNLLILITIKWEKMYYSILSFRKILINEKVYAWE